MARQFGRYAEVEIRDFNSKVKTIIGNEFEIEFEYFKTLDQTKEDDSGVIRIFGLTPERVESLQFDGGEVHFRCGYTHSNIETLFVAYISRLYSNNTDNTTVTTIECSANLLTHYYSGVVNSEFTQTPQSSIYSVLKQVATLMGAEQMRFSLEVVRKFGAEFEEFIKTYPVNITLVGSANDILANVCQTIGLESHRMAFEGKDTLFFGFNAAGVLSAGNLIAPGYQQIASDNNNPSAAGTFVGYLYQAGDKDNSIIVLDNSSGLIESKTEYKIAHEYLNEVVYDTDEETFASQTKRAKRAASEAERDAKEAARKAKAEAAGKPFKPRKRVGVKQTTIEVTRKYTRVKALLNPLARPQSMVAVLVTSTEEVEDYKEVFTGSEEEFKKADTVLEYEKLRIRNATYKGNNKRNDWTMDLYCENTNINKELSEEELRRAAYTTSGEDFQTSEGGDEGGELE